MVVLSSLAEIINIPLHVTKNQMSFKLKFNLLETIKQHSQEKMVVCDTKQKSSPQKDCDHC